MGSITNMQEWRRKKEGTKQKYKDSLNNEKVMDKYNIERPTLDERMDKISERIKRINQLMRELEENNSDKKK